MGGLCGGYRAVHLDRGGLRERQSIVSVVAAKVNARCKAASYIDGTGSGRCGCRSDQSRYRRDFGVDTARRVRVVFVFRGSRKPIAAVIGVAVGVALLPLMTRQLAEGDKRAPPKVRTARLNLRSF